MSALLPGLMHPGRRKGDILSITPSPPPSASARTAASSVGNSQSSPLCYKQPCALRLLAQAWNSCGCLALEASFSHSIPILKRKRPARCARWGSNPCLVANTSPHSRPYGVALWRDYRLTPTEGFGEGWYCCVPI